MAACEPEERVEPVLTLRVKVRCTAPNRQRSMLPCPTLFLAERQHMYRRGLCIVSYSVRRTPYSVEVDVVFVGVRLSDFT